MGYKYTYTSSDLADIVGTVNRVSRDACNSSNDGFIAFGAKQDLYRLKWIIDDALKKCPSFSSVETDWLKEQEQKKIIKILKDDIQ